MTGSAPTTSPPPHTRPVYALIDGFPDRSIAVDDDGIGAAAGLDSVQRVSTGAGLYDEMCTGCHLGPIGEPSEMSQGLYPQAPDPAKHHDLKAAQQFSIIKRGIKLRAMSAWGKPIPTRSFET